MIITFIEMPVFTKEIRSLLPDDHYRVLQKELLFRPDAGDLIRGSGGLRKLRWNRPGMGKRGGLRIIYYFDKPETIYMLFAYPKNRQETLTGKQLKYLTAIMKEYLL
jgi:mRNA-degrading endonuclease RelE of RelBE toxin-antitoxin system